MPPFPAVQLRLVARSGAAGTLLALLAAPAADGCREYEPSLLVYSDGGAGPLLDAALDSPADDALDAEAEADGQVSSDADASVDGPDDAAQDAASEEAAGGCSATQADCDGDEDNGCETDLTSDGESCGECGHGCLGAGCIDGRCEPIVLASGQSVPSNVAVDQTHLYWTNQVPGGAVMRVPRLGGTPEIVAALALPPGGLAVDDTSVFWSEFASEGTVWKLAKAEAGNAAAAVALATGQGTSTSLALDANHVYWTTPGTVRRVPKAGGPIEGLASGQATPGGLLAAFGFAFWTNVLGGTVVGIDATGDAGIQVYASGQAYPAGLAADLGNLYWANHTTDADGGPPRVMMVARTGAATPQVLADDQAGPLGLTQLGTHVYWTNNVGGTVMRIPKTGGDPEELASGQQAPAGIAVDADAVYWVNRDDGTVMAVAR